MAAIPQWRLIQNGGTKMASNQTWPLLQTSQTTDNTISLSTNIDMRTILAPLNNTDKNNT